MNSLVNYGSDDDYDDSSEEKQTDWRGTASKDKQGSSGRQTDANYEEVQMELSEGSNDSKPETKERSRRSRERDSKDRRERERSRHDRERRGSRDKDRDSKSRSDYNHSRRDRDRKSRRSSSRERRRHSRSRSRSRDRSRKYSKRYERGNKNDQTEKTERQKAGGGGEDEKRSTPNESDRFFMPGITGRFRDQIERRKQLWQKKDVDPKDNKNNGQGKKVWEATTFAQDTDGKVASKFKRLMGIRGSSESGGSGTDNTLRKQEEMFSSMEQQYEVARTATHTMRGVGLGFGSYQR